MLFILGWFSLLLSKINCVSVWLVKRIARNLCRYLFYGCLSFKQIELTAIYRMRSFLFVLRFSLLFFTLLPTAELAHLRFGSSASGGGNG